MSTHTTTLHTPSPLLPTGTLKNSVIAPLSLLIKTLNVWIKRQQGRNALLHLDDRMLADIGLTRADAYIEIRKPFWRP